MKQMTIELAEKNYFGGKAHAGTISKIIREIPKHSHYVTGFAGLDAIRRFMLPSRFNTIIEINPEIVQLWKNAIFHHKDISTLNLMVLQQSFFKIDLEAFYLPTTFLYLDPPYH